MKLTGCGAHKREMRNAYKILIINPEGPRPPGKP
jgi:hypothetical protein